MPDRDIVVLLDIFGGKHNDTVGVLNGVFDCDNSEASSDVSTDQNETGPLGARFIACATAALDQKL